MSKLEQQLAEISAKIEYRDALVSSVSAVSVAWHIDHILMVMKGITERLKTSEPDKYRWKFSFSKIVIFLRGAIPRGLGKAPKATNPQGDIDLNLLQKHFESASNSMKEIVNLDKNLYFEHPYFGHLKLKDSIRFLEIHNAHHLAIINDIDRRAHV